MKSLARGFTLIELVVTVAIVGILASVAVPLGDLGLQRARESQLRSGLQQIRTAIDAYKRAYDAGRILPRAGATGYPRTLAELAGGVEDAKSPVPSKIYFLRRLPRDPFYPDRDAPADETWGKRAYSSPAEAPLEGADVFDVYSRSQRTGLNGQPYQEW
jgi:general secretion pathway protein G